MNENGERRTDLTDGECRSVGIIDSLRESIPRRDGARSRRSIVVDLAR